MPAVSTLKFDSIKITNPVNMVTAPTWRLLFAIPLLTSLFTIAVTPPEFLT